MPLSFSGGGGFSGDIGVATGTSVTVTGLLQAGTTIGISTDVLLNRDAANILALRNSTSAQTFRAYNTYKDESNYERGIFDWNVTANTLTIGTQAAGTGFNRTIDFVYAGATRMRISTNTFVSSGEIQFGQSTAVPYVVFDPQSAGKFIFKDGAAGATAIMQFAGSSSSFPSLKRSSTAIHVRLADDSAYAPFSAELVTVAAGTATPAGGSTSARLLFGTTSGFGIYYGSGAPSVGAAKGSLYMRSDGSGATDRAYVNTDGSTTWTAIATVA